MIINFHQNQKNDYSKYSNEELYQKLLSIYPKTNILERALDYYSNNGIIKQEQKTDKLLYDVIFIGLTTDRKNLYNRIDKRVDSMISEGLIDEAKKIFDLNIRTKAVLTPIGYK